MRKSIYSMFLALLLVATFGCKDDDTEATLSNLTLNITGLEDVGASAVYEGWLIVDGAPVSTGTFNVDANGTPSVSVFTVNPDDLESATAFVLSIEPVPDNDPAPSDVKILGGDFSNGMAQVSVSHPAAFGTGFTGVSGGYILATPTTTATDDDLSGVWFLREGQPGLENLPDLSGLAGWRYEGWAVIDGTPVSTGTFEMASGADNEAPFSGADSPGPAFPGEDFIVNAPEGLTFPTDLSGQVIVVSIEPVPDNDPAPFTLKPVRGEVPSDASPMTFYSLENIAANTYPSGSVEKN